MSFDLDFSTKKSEANFEDGLDVNVELILFSVMSKFELF
jgi:hypothetical protein